MQTSFVMLQFLTIVYIGEITLLEDINHSGEGSGKLLAPLKGRPGKLVSCGEAGWWVELLPKKLEANSRHQSLALLTPWWC